MRYLLPVTTVLALLGSATIGGVFFGFSSFIMRALGRLPSAEGIAAMQQINVTVINPHFLGTFIGTAAISAAAIVMAGLRWGEPGMAWIIAGGVLYLLGTFVVTIAANVPLNDALAAARPGQGEDLWAHYLSRWTLWNHVRTAAALLAALCLCLGSLQSARERAWPQDLRASPAATIERSPDETLD